MSISKSNEFTVQNDLLIYIFNKIWLHVKVQIHVLPIKYFYSRTLVNDKIVLCLSDLGTTSQHRSYCVVFVMSMKESMT